jgi:hypothetical protein
MRKNWQVILALLGLVLLAGLFLGERAFSQEPTATGNLGRYAAAAPDLIVNTATGEVKDSGGHVIVAAIEPQGAIAGKYSATGYVSTAATALGFNSILNRLIKGVTVIQTDTGQGLINKKIYYDQDYRPGDLSG